jgi:hypothetical protein
MLALLLIPGTTLAQLDARSFTVTPIPDTARVGDSVRLRFRLLVTDRDLLTDTVPRPVAELPAGVRVLSVEKLRRGSDRVFTGEALVAFYRPGSREIPAFGVPWVQVVTGHRGVVSTEAASVEIAPMLPAGNPALRDIREPEPPPALGLWLSLPLLVAAALGWYLLRRRRQVPVEPVPMETPAPAEPPPDAYRVAVARLAGIERERWPECGEVERHYEAAADVLRDYLEAAEEIPARERTSGELLWALPPRLMEGGLRRLTAEVLEEADLVKFARRRPGAAAAAAHLRRSRELLDRWHEAAAEAHEEADAIR